MINFKVSEKVYEIPLIISVGDYDKCAEQNEKKYNLKKLDQSYFGGEAKIWTNNGNAICTIWLPVFSYHNPEDISTLSHEIDHVAFRILEHVEIPIVDNMSNHAYIYLKQYFLNESLKRLKKETNK